MTVRAEERPTISLIYASFSQETQRVFRRAMEVSRGSVVRVADLLLALWELARGDAGELVAADWQPFRRTDSTEAWLTPMSNEPALRELLEAAYRLQLSVDPKVITPSRLWEAAAQSGHLPRRRGATLKNAPAVQQQETPIQSILLNATPTVGQIVQEWLNANAETVFSERSRLLGQLEPLVRQLEMRPESTSK